jgi:hypothetical protein|mmetsp:Transcript_30735/g.51908  ORF Transcript_30735/g.51908 Transcript_30735/m.51908 type:complete len:87 (+) Transcript_30735:374-634(+)
MGAKLVHLQCARLEHIPTLLPVVNKVEQDNIPHATIHLKQTTDPNQCTMHHVVPAAPQKPPTQSGLSAEDMRFANGMGLGHAQSPQ